MSDIIKKRSITKLGIISIWIILLIFIIYQSNPEIIPNNKNNDKEFTPYPSYFLNYTQNMEDYSYKINIVKVDNNPLKINDVKLRIRTVTGTHTYHPFFIDDYLSTQDIFFKHFIEYNSSISASEQEYINVSMSITYFDNKVTGVLSTNDFFILKVKNLDNNEYYYISNFRFEIITIEKDLIGVIKFEDPIPDNPIIIVEYEEPSSSIFLYTTDFFIILALTIPLVAGSLILLFKRKKRLGIKKTIKN